MRRFNGYIAQGIDDNWLMHVIPIAFEPVKGKHTSSNIKCNNSIVLFQINLYSVQICD